MPETPGTRWPIPSSRMTPAGDQPIVGVMGKPVPTDVQTAALQPRQDDLTRYGGLSDEQKARLWAEENAEALRLQRARIDSIGVFGEDLRTW